MTFMAASMSLAFNSSILVSAICFNWSREIEPAIAVPGGLRTGFYAGGLFDESGRRRRFDDE